MTDPRHAIGPMTALDDLVLGMVESRYNAETRELFAGWLRSVRPTVAHRAVMLTEGALSGRRMGEQKLTLVGFNPDGEPIVTPDDPTYDLSYHPTVPPLSCRRQAASGIAPARSHRRTRLHTVGPRDDREDSVVGRGSDRAGNDTPDRLLDVKEAAEILGLKSPRTLYKWSYDGRIRSVKISRSVRFYRSDVQRILVEGERPACASFGRARQQGAWGAR